MVYPSDINLQLKSPENSIVHHTRVNNTFISKIYTEHGNITAVLCGKFQNDWKNATDVIDERDFTRFEFRVLWGESEMHRDQGCS